MASTVGELKIKLSFDNNGLTTSQKQVESKLSTWSKITGKDNGNTFGNAFSVAIGSIISKGFSTITSAISNSMSSAINRVDTLNNFPKVMQALGYSAEASSSSVKMLSDRIDGLPTSLNDIVGNVQMLSSSMGNLNDGMVNATTVGIALNDMFLAGGQGTEAATRAFTQFNQMLARGKVDMQSWNSLVEVAPGQMKQLAQSLLGASANQKDLYEALQEGTISFDQMNEAMIKLDNEGGEGFSSWAQQAKDNTGGIGTAFENVQNRIAKAIQKIIDHIGSEKIANAINDISSSFSVIADIAINIIDFVSANQWLIPFLGAVAVAIWAVNAAMYASPVTWIIVGIAAVVAGIILLITHIQEVGQFFTSVFGAIGEFAASVWQGIMNIFSGVGDFFRGVFQNAFDIVTGIFGNIVNFFKGVWDGIVGLFTHVGQAIGDAVSGAFKFVVNGVIGFIERFINGPVDAINGLIGIINNIPGIDIGYLPTLQLPRLAQGGLVTGSTIANIGEAGAEAVIPLERNTGNWSGLLASTLAEELEDESLGIGGGVTIENMSFNIDNELDARDIGRVMMQSIRRAA